MVKRFIADLWAKWRELEGLPVGKPYEEEFLGRKPHHTENFGAGTLEEFKERNAVRAARGQA
jgi:hypothetical protein